LTFVVDLFKNETSHAPFQWQVNLYLRQCYVFNRNKIQGPVTKIVVEEKVIKMVTRPHDSIYTVNLIFPWGYIVTLPVQSLLVTVNYFSEHPEIRWIRNYFCITCLHKNIYSFAEPFTEIISCGVFIWNILNCNISAIGSG
jgi:hypothetical protein